MLRTWKNTPHIKKRKKEVTSISHECVPTRCRHEQGTLGLPGGNRLPGGTAARLKPPAEKGGKVKYSALPWRIHGYLRNGRKLDFLQMIQNHLLLFLNCEF